MINYEQKYIELSAKYIALANEQVALSDKYCALLNEKSDNLRKKIAYLQKKKLKWYHWVIFPWGFLRLFNSIETSIGVW